MKVAETNPDLEDSSSRWIEKSPKRRTRYTVPPTTNPIPIVTKVLDWEAFIFSAVKTPSRKLNWVKRARMFDFGSMISDNNNHRSKAYAITRKRGIRILSEGLNSEAILADKSPNGAKNADLNRIEGETKKTF